jgi:hypothetical protein
VSTRAFLAVGPSGSIPVNVLLFDETMALPMGADQDEKSAMQPGLDVRHNCVRSNAGRYHVFATRSPRKLAMRIRHVMCIGVQARKETMVDCKGADDERGIRRSRQSDDEHRAED